MTDADSLNEAIRQYETQLSQVQVALSVTNNGADRENLLSLCSDIQELIDLTRENLNGLNAAKSKISTDISVETNDPLEKEYALFKAMLDNDSVESKNDEQSKGDAQISVDIEEELKALEGSKCRAPHGSGWGGIGHHNAMVCSVYANEDGQEVTSMSDIKIRVMFTNPTHKEMLPCPYYLDGECKFSDDQCHYSHGEIVPLSSLEEFREPDFSTIKMGSRVLAMQKNKLWHRAVVLRTPETEKDEYRIKFEASGSIAEVNLHDLFPLNDTDLNMSDSSDDSECETEVVETNQEELVHQSLLAIPGGEPLGGWERHTRGIGSKLMADMGYVTGTGLGKRADGRVEPVAATVLPAGKSLDHCMELRENAGGDKDLFSVQRRMKKQQRAAEQQREKQYRREAQREQSNVFNFINATLGDKREDESKPGTSSENTSLKTKSSQNLNVDCLRVGENIKRLEREVSKLEGSLGRHTKGTPLYNNVALQWDQKRKELDDSRNVERKILSEQNQRRSAAKLTIF